MVSAQPIRTNCDAILFDLDGVLIDSTTCVERHWRNWAEQHGLDADSILRIAHGVRNVDTMRLLAPHLDVEREASLFAAGEVADTAGVVAVQGASGMIADLQGASWAVVTSCSTALAHARLKAAQLPIPPLLITGDDVSRGKPDPQPYLMAASGLGIAAQACIVVEDAPAGIRAGKNAGMRVVGIASTYGRPELVESGADVLIDQLSQLRVRQAADGRRLVIQIEAQA
jgi:sugar-phosphatase